MSNALMDIEKQIPLISLNEQISLMAYLANAIKKNTEAATSKESSISKRLGIAKGKFEIGDDIDFCNNEIAEMFGV